MKKFGEVLENVNYVERCGVYGLPYINGKIGVVKSKLGYFALGGGVENGESDIECLRREVREEIGKDIVIGDFLEEVVNYVYVEKSNNGYKKVMKFFYIDLLDDIEGKIELDHELIFLDIDVALNKMYLEGQAYVIKKYRK